MTSGRGKPQNFRPHSDANIVAPIPTATADASAFRLVVNQGFLSLIALEQAPAGRATPYSWDRTTEDAVRTAEVGNAIYYTRQWR